MAENTWSSYPIFQILKRREGRINAPQPATVGVEVKERQDDGGDNWEGGVEEVQ